LCLSSRRVRGRRATRRRTATTCSCRFRRSHKGLLDANPDFACRPLLRAERGLHGHRLSYDTGVRLAGGWTAVLEIGFDDELIAARGRRCARKEPVSRERHAGRKHTRLHRPRHGHVGTGGGRARADEPPRRQRLGIRLADGGWLRSGVDNREPWVDRNAELALGHIVTGAPGRPTLCGGQVVIPEPEMRKAGTCRDARDDTALRHGEAWRKRALDDLVAERAAVDPLISPRPGRTSE
jgi:hypothetical protein